MTREAEAILAKWRELERAAELVDDPELRSGLERRIRELRGDYQAAVRTVLDEHRPVDAPRPRSDRA